MSTTGNDLRRYLIVPSSSPPSGVPLSNPAVDTSELLSAGQSTGSLGNWLQARDTPRNTEMEIHQPTQHPPLPSAYAADNMSNNGVFKLDDFMESHKDEHDARILARETTNTAKDGMPSAKKLKTDANAAPLAPVAVSARSSKHTIILHEKYQALALPQPLFTYGGGSDLGWTVQVSFPGLDVQELQDLSVEGRFNSKQEAKEAMSKTALEVLEKLEEEGRVQKAGKVTKSKAVGGGVSGQQQQKKEEKEPGPNYVGQLLEFQRSTGAPQPTYIDYQIGTRFACLLSIDGQATQFGSLELLRSSKKAARQEAARHAVEYFQSIGAWPKSFTAVGGIKKKKKPQSEVPEIVSSTSTSSQYAKSNSSSVPLTTSLPTPSNSSYTQRVATLAVMLSLATPEWRYTSHPSDPDFHNVACFFKNGGAHEGPIGEVRNIFGKKKAKEECARLTLEYLQGVKETRLNYGLKMMEGISGGEGIVGAAAGRAVEGEGRGAGGRGSDDMDVDAVEDEEEDEFEDAVEMVKS